MIVYVVAEIEHIEVGGSGMRPSEIRVVTAPEVAAKILCTQPRRELAYNGDETEEQFNEALRTGKSAMSKWRYVEDRDRRTTVVLEAVPKELEGDDPVAQAVAKRDQEWILYSGMPAPSQTVELVDPAAKLVAAREAKSRACQVLREAEEAALLAEFKAAKATAPEGYRMEFGHSIYNGSHSECGYSDGYVLLAVPDGAGLEDIKKEYEGLTHFSDRSRGWDALQARGVLEWDGEKWRSIEMKDSPNIIIREDYRFEEIWKRVMGDSND